MPPPSYGSDKRECLLCSSEIQMDGTNSTDVVCSSCCEICNSDAVEDFVSSFLNKEMDEYRTGKTTRESLITAILLYYAWASIKIKFYEYLLRIAKDPRLIDAAPEKAKELTCSATAVIADFKANTYNPFKEIMTKFGININNYSELHENHPGIVQLRLLFDHFRKAIKEKK